MSDFNDNTENNEAQEEQKKKLTDFQLRLFQVIAGVISAAAIIVSLFLSTIIRTDPADTSQGSSLISLAWVAVFLVVLFGRRTIENKYRLRLNLFGLAMIDGIASGIIIFYATQIFPADTGSLSQAWKLVILIGGLLLVIGLGVVWPYLRYRKRVENGTLPPIRLPEKQEKDEETKQPESGVSTLEQRIAEMTRELDAKKNDEEQK
jgi:hypothetical protein